MRKAFTLIELLVVISIIGMLAGLLLPAVQQAREAGRRATCINNQKNVALALINYESRGSFPGFTNRLSSGNWVGWHAAIFPYIEETNLYDQMGLTPNFGTFIQSSHVGPNADYADLENKPGDNYSTHRIPIYQCPSSGVSGSRVVAVANCGPMNLNAGGSRAATAAGDLAATDWYEPGTESTTVFFDRLKSGYNGKEASRYTQNLDFISMKNGTTHTILATENVNAGNWDSWEEPQVGFCYSFEAESAGSNINGVSPVAYWDGETDDNAESLFAARINMYRNAGPSGIGDPGYGSEFDGGVGATALGIYRVARPSSNHPGLVIMSFCDGGARQVNEVISPEVIYWAMMPNSGKVVSGL